MQELILVWANMNKKARHYMPGFASVHSIVSGVMEYSQLTLNLFRYACEWNVLTFQARAGVFENAAELLRASAADSPLRTGH